MAAIFGIVTGGTGLPLFAAFCSALDCGGYAGGFTGAYLYKQDKIKAPHHRYVPASPPPPAPCHHDSSYNSGDTAVAAILVLAVGAAIASH